MTERRSAEEHFGRSAATQTAEEAAELASLGPAALGPLSAPESQRRRSSGAASAAASSAAVSCTDPTIRMSRSARTPPSALSSAVTSLPTGAKRGSSSGPTATSTCGCSTLRMRVLRNSAALAPLAELASASRARVSREPCLLFRMRQEKEWVSVVSLSLRPPPGLPLPLHSRRLSLCRLKFISHN